MLEFVADGKTGFVVPPDSPRELAARVDALYRDREKARTMGERGREVLAKIGWGRVVERFVG